jgi:hypothetical protein
MPRSRPTRPNPEYAGRGRRGYWRIDDARAVLARQAASGLSLRGFALREGLSVARLYRWRREVAGAAGRPAFLEVLPARPRPPVEVVLGTGVVLRVPVGFEDETVRRLVDILGRQGARC